jgi:2-C-methyl-D-erythritol 4-phosphate cytidylyltransferase
MGFDKVWADLGGEPVVAHSVRMLRSAGVDALVLVVVPDRVQHARRLVTEQGLSAKVCTGGVRRRDSVANGLSHLGAPEWIIIHDAARPFATREMVLRGLEAARANGAAVAAVPMADTVKRVRGGVVVETLDRDEIFRVQTPQVFRRDVLERALAFSQEDVSDEATLVERTGGTVAVFQGSPINLKLTTPADLRLAAAMLEASIDAIP